MARGVPGKPKSDPDAEPGGQGATTDYEADLWRMADTLRGSMDAGEYKHVHVLTPGRYVGAAPQGDDGGPFEDKMKRLTTRLREQQAGGARLDAAITDNLKALGFGGRKS